MGQVRRGSFPIFVCHKGSEAEKEDNTYCEQLEGCVRDKSITDGGMPFHHELVLRYWVTL